MLVHVVAKESDIKEFVDTKLKHSEYWTNI